MDTSLLMMHYGHGMKECLVTIPEKRIICRMRLSMAMALAVVAAMAHAADPAVIDSLSQTSWKLQNDAMSMTVMFRDGSLAVGSLKHRATGVEALDVKGAPPLFTHRIDGADVRADDGKWTLSGATVSDLRFYERSWGKRLEIVMERHEPVPFQTRHVFEIHDGRAGVRYHSYVKNLTDSKVTIHASEVLHLNLPDRPHTLYAIEGIVNWIETRDGMTHGGRNALVRYDAGNGWYVLPENNWATCLESGPHQGHSSEKLLGIDVWSDGAGMRVKTNPKAVQLVLFPHEEVEYFAVNLGLFEGDVLDGRVASAEHLRKRYKFRNPSHVLSTNDWQWGGQGGKRTEANYREIVIPKARDAGFDRVHIDDFWYEPEDGTDPKGKWTDMPSLCEHIIAEGMKPGHWFSLQGKICVNGWANGRDCADPANVDFKLKQMRDVLIGQYHTAWDQVDAGLLWKTPEVTNYSHPSDSVYRKILGMRRYMNTIAHEYPDFIMQTTCEVDNPAGPGASDSRGNQNIGLIHLADNGIAGMFRRTEYSDDVRDLFASVGMFPVEGMLSTWGEDGNINAAWKDSPMWYYQFLLARHTSIYSWPGDWSGQSVAHLRRFNDWRKNPRIEPVLNELMHPVYNGPDWKKNEGPWCWMFADAKKSQALVFAINHLGLNPQHAFHAKLRSLADDRKYLVLEITQTPDGGHAYAFKGDFAGDDLRKNGLPIDLAVGAERCAAFWIQEKSGDLRQVLYADAAVESYQQHQSTVDVKGGAGAIANLFVFDPATLKVDRFRVKLDDQGRAKVVLNSTPMISGGKDTPLVLPVTAAFTKRDTTTAGGWHGKYGTKAAWLAGQPLAPQGGYELGLRDGTVHVWGEDDVTPRVPALPVGETGKKVAACWTAAESFELLVKPPEKVDESPYRLTVYLMDYRNDQFPARAMEVTLRDGSKKLLDMQGASKAETATGIYLIWNVTGPVTVTVRKTEGINAAVSGVFVDEGENGSGSL